EHPPHRRGRRLRPRGAPRRPGTAPLRHLGHQPRPGPAHLRAGARPGRLRRRERPPRRGVRAGVHGPDRRHPAARDQGRHRLPRLVHQRPDRGPPGGRRDAARQDDRPGHPDARRPGLGRGEEPGRGRGPGPGLPRRRRRVARRRVLDVPGHEPRPAPAGGALGVHEQPQLPGPPGQGGPHPPGLAGRGRRDRADRPSDRPRRPVRRPCDRWSLTAMDAFTTHTGTAAPLRRSNVDTDQIIPAEYLKRITRTGFEDGLFSAWRTNEPEFVLNLPQYADASILVAGPDFGTGSSREHAVWALMDGGFRVVISSRFGDIFRNNSTKAGLLTVLLPQEDVEALWKAIEEDPSQQVTVDLEAKEIR